jgi:hypothetical protein
MSSSLRLAALAIDAVASACNSRSGAWPSVAAHRRVASEISTLGHVFWVGGGP